MRSFSATLMLITHQLLIHSSSNPFFAHAFAPIASVRSTKLASPFVVVANNSVGVGPRTQSGKDAVILKVSPSGIDELPQIAQAGVFFGYYTALGLATYLTTKLLENLSKSIGLERWRAGIIESTLPLILGLFYVAAGVGHFISADDFRDIYPPVGTWGFWYLPGSSAFHVTWTGAVEVLGGAGLLSSGVRGIFSSEEDDDESFFINLIQPASALALFVLTILVTPANIYMFTHGAVMGDMPPLDVSFHAVRFVVQVTFLSLLLTLAKDSFFFAWGDELD